MPAQFLFVLDSALIEWLAGSEHFHLILFQLFTYVFQHLPIEHIFCACGILMTATYFALRSALYVRFIYDYLDVFLEDQANGRYVRTPVFVLIDIVLLTAAAASCTSAVKLAACDLLWASRQLIDGSEAVNPGCEAHAFERAVQLTKLSGWVLHAHVALPHVVYELLWREEEDFE